MSPAMRWEKNSIGMRSTCHKNVVLPITASLPFMRSEHIASADATMICTAASADIAAIVGMNHSVFCPVSSRS